MRSTALPAELAPLAAHCHSRASGNPASIESAAAERLDPRLRGDDSAGCAGMTVRAGTKARSAAARLTD